MQKKVVMLLKYMLLCSMYLRLIDFDLPQNHHVFVVSIHIIFAVFKLLLIPINY
jgi:hypothetical protein